MLRDRASLPCLSRQPAFLTDTSRLPPYSMYGMYELTKVYICSSIRVCLYVCACMYYMCILNVPFSLCCPCLFRLSSCRRLQQQQNSRTHHQYTAVHNNSSSSSIKSSIVLLLEDIVAQNHPATRPRTHHVILQGIECVVIERESNGYRPGMELNYDTINEKSNR